MASKINEEIKKQVIERRLNGESTKSLSLEYEISNSVIYKWMRELDQGLLTGKRKAGLINITNIIKPELINFTINGFEVTIDESNLSKLLKGLK